MSQYKFTLNPYGGCAFGCEYCYARFFAPSSKQRETWGQWVSVKTNARKLIAKACRSGMLNSGDVVYMSSVTGPYQPVERRLGLTRALPCAGRQCNIRYLQLGEPFASTRLRDPYCLFRTNVLPSRVVRSVPFEEGSHRPCEDNGHGNRHQGKAKICCLDAIHPCLPFGDADHQPHDRLPA